MYFKFITRKSNFFIKTNRNNSKHQSCTHGLGKDSAILDI